MAEIDEGATIPGVLVDIQNRLNQKVNSILGNLVGKYKGQRLVDEVWERLGKVVPNVLLPYRSQIEVWAINLGPAGSGKFYSFRPQRENTKYAVLTNGPWRLNALDALIKVNGIVIGSDKLGHFFGTGGAYYDEKHINGKDPKAYGISTERVELGLKTTGVFSTADLAANEAGLRFYEQVAKGRFNASTFAIADYVSQRWSERISGSAYSPLVATQVWSNILTRRRWTGSRNNVMMSIQFNPGSSPGHLTAQYGAGAPGPHRLTNIVLTPKASKDVPGAKKGAEIDYDWSMDGKRGRGRWTSESEESLVGTWGEGTSNAGGGTWNITARP